MSAMLKMIIGYGTLLIVVDSFEHFLQPRRTDSVENGSSSLPCLCIFDIDRTLTGAQGKVSECPRNKIIEGVHDSGYGGGELTLSALAAEGIDKTFCGSCNLGICSAGDAGGHGSAERQYLVEHVLRTARQDELVKAVESVTWWSPGTDVQSPLVVGQPDKQKQHAVEGIRQWYEEHGISISDANVFFFGDRTENMPPFAETQFNAREISCGSRDEFLYNGRGMVGFCGATPEEIVNTPRISNCVPKCEDTSDWTNGFTGCGAEGYDHDDGCMSSGWTCSGYVRRGWCSDGHQNPEASFAFGVAFNYPEQNCCACGGGDVGTCKPADVSRRRRGGGSSTCSCRRRSGSDRTGWQCKDNFFQRESS